VSLLGYFPVIRVDYGKSVDEMGIDSYDKESTGNSVDGRMMMTDPPSRGKRNCQAHYSPRFWGTNLDLLGGCESSMVDNVYRKLDYVLSDQVCTEMLLLISKAP